MQCGLALVLVGALSLAGALGAEITEVAVVGQPVAEGGWEGYVDHVLWADARTVVYAGRSGFVKAFQLAPTKPLWATRVEGKVEGIVGSAAVGRVFVCTVNKADRRVQTLALSDGRALGEITDDQIAKKAGADAVSIGQLAWIPARNQLVITGSAQGDRNPDGKPLALPGFAQSSDYGVLILDADRLTPAGRLRLRCRFPQVVPSPDGGSILSFYSQGAIRIWDLKQKREVYRLGEDPKEEGFTIDAPFISNAAFDGRKTLIYTVDNGGWGDGTVHVHDTAAKRETARFESRNAHVVVQVDFTRQRIVLTGTSRNVVVTDFAGKVIGERPDVGQQRNVAMALSPDGGRVAIASWDNTVRVLDLGKPQPTR